MQNNRHRRGLAGAAPLAGQQHRGLHDWLAIQSEAFHVRVAAWRREEGERRRLFNWLPVAMGLGVLAYFAADREPHLAPPVIGLVVSLGVALLARNGVWLRGVAIAFAFTFLGFAAAVTRTASVAGPVLDRIQVGLLSGHVESVERRAGGARLVISPNSFADLPREKLPSRVRVAQRGGGISAGDHITGQARLLPPPEPARPGGYDFARDAFFRGVGAVGSFSSTPQISAAPSPPDFWLRFNAAIDRGRNHLTDRIQSIVGGQEGAVAAALVTGKRGLILEPTNEALRAAGIYHIVSISGLHMVLVAGAIFWLVRALLALGPWLVLHLPVKKIAALVAMLGATAYCVFSGSDVATERSLIMTLVMLGAILFDRPALSMRNLAIAAIIVLLREPETLLGPSFQMSFGAVAALIAYAERMRGATAQPPPAFGLVGRMARIVKLAIIADLITTLLATAATAPFGLFHFNTANPYGLIGNALALPFISLIVMPAAVAGALLYPFGLDAIAWWAMGQGTRPLLAFSAEMASWPRSSVKLPAYGALPLMLFALSLLWVALWTTPLRWLAALPLTIGLALAGTPARPDGYVDREGKGLALRGEDGRLIVLGKPGAFALAQWLAADGDQRKPGDPSLMAGAACDSAGCVADLGKRGAISHATTRRAVSEDCDKASVVVTPIPWRGQCRALLIDRQMLDRLGSATLHRTEAGWRISGARTGEQVDRPATAPLRPWLRQPRAVAISAAPSRQMEPEAITAPTEETEDLRGQ
jgi:competence protein ComEC